MKRYFTLVFVCLAILLLLNPSTFAGNSGKKGTSSQSSFGSFSPPLPPPPPTIPALNGTSWTGELTLVGNSSGSTTTPTVTMAFWTESSNTSIVYGTITGLSSNALSFTGVIPSFGPPRLQISAVNMFITADIMPASQSSTTFVINVTGSDLSTGNSFTGQLTE